MCRVSPCRFVVKKSQHMYDIFLRYGSQLGESEPSCTGPCSPEHWCPAGSVSPMNMQCSNGLISRLGDPKCFECSPDFYQTAAEIECKECGGKRTWEAAIYKVICFFCFHITFF